MAARGWFVDVDTSTPGFPWQICAQVDSGTVLSLEIWFETAEKALEYIREHLVGLPLLNDEGQPEL